MVTVKMVMIIQIFHTVLITQLSVMRWSRRPCAEVISLLPYGYQGQPGHQDWWQMPLPTEQYRP